MIKYILLSFLLIANIQAQETISETKCLADNIYFEARNESIHGQLAVALVTANRVKSRHYPNTMCSVVWEYKQFSWTIDGKSDIPRNKKAYATAELLAIHVISSNEELPDITKGATHYHNNTVSPYWADKLKFIMVIDNHIFYKFKK